MVELVVVEVATYLPKYGFCWGAQERGDALSDALQRKLPARSNRGHILSGGSRQKVRWCSEVDQTRKTDSDVCKERRTRRTGLPSEIFKTPLAHHHDGRLQLGLAQPAAATSPMLGGLVQDGACRKHLS